jgi:hypothetical protein
MRDFCPSYVLLAKSRIGGVLLRLWVRDEISGCNVLPEGCVLAREGVQPNQVQRSTTGNDGPYWIV